METELNLYQRINEVRKAIGYIQKDKSVSAGAGANYRAVTHDTVTAMIRPAMIDQGIICFPSLLDSTVTQTTNKEGNVSNIIRYAATYSFTFLNADKPEEQLVIIIEAHANDNQDKAPGKALSYAKKYAVLKLFEIETGEDEESRHQENTFDIAPTIAELEQATSRQVLEYVYLKGKESAMKANDTASFKVLGSKVKELLKKFPDVKDDGK